MKKFRVGLRVTRDFVRVVHAKTEAQAIRAAKEAIHSKGIKIRVKDFEKICDNAYRIE